MSANISAQALIGHILNGTLDTSLCRICLKPFGEVCENIFTQFWFEKRTLSLADILRDVCKAEFSEKDNYNVCSDCIVEAFTAYNFYLKYQSTTKLLADYVNELEECSTSADRMCIDNYNDTQMWLQISRCNINKIDFQEYDVENFLGKAFELCPEEFDIGIKKKDSNCKTLFNEFSDDDADDLKVSYLEPREDIKRKKKTTKPKVQPKKKKTAVKPRPEPKKRHKCGLCPLETTDFDKFLKHTKIKHGLNHCEICNGFYRHVDLDSHLKLHEQAYCCDTCQAIVKDHEAMVQHLAVHETGIHICDKCGYVANKRTLLTNHMRLQHSGKNFSCVYCGRQHKKQEQLERHLAKHEVVIRHKNIVTTKQLWKIMSDGSSKRREICSECGSDFVDIRALKMHAMRVHTGEQPFVCEECGRGFVSKYLKKQHIDRHHRPPQFRCPLCPNAFPTVSYVSQHVRKVHLRKDKRYNRQFPMNVTWPTVTVNFEQLRVEVQHRLLEMVNAGELELPVEMMTDSVKKLLKIKVEE